MTKWMVCAKGQGRQIVDGVADSMLTSFDKDSVGLIKEERQDGLVIWFIGSDSHWLIEKSEARSIDVTKTGDKFSHKICNICHCLKMVEQFDKNQNNLHGAVRRPSCRKCRSDIDKRAPKTSQAKEIARKKPQQGTPFKCPICRKRSIVGVTAKIVADHDHHTGNIRDFICDSCNTGLGRFKNGENYLMNAVNYIKERDTL